MIRALWHWLRGHDGVGRWGRSKDGGGGWACDTCSFAWGKWWW